MASQGITKNLSAAQAAPEIISQLRTIAVALISDSMHRNCGSIDLRPFHKPAPLVGTAVTVRTRGGDNLAVLRAYDFCRPGDVSNAIFGGIMSLGAQKLGLAGLVVDGAIRDVAEIGERTFPVYARGVSHRGPYKDGPGAINVEVTVGGMVVRPGDIVVGDRDGLCAFPQALATEVIAKALKQHAAEEATIQAINEGRWDRSFVDALEARCLN
jgi:regulator of RNase E activity RraA